MPGVALAVADDNDVEEVKAAHSSFGFEPLKMNYVCIVAEDICSLSSAGKTANVILLE